MSEFNDLNDSIDADLEKSQVYASLLNVAKNFLSKDLDEARRINLLEELDFIIEQMKVGEAYDKNMLDYLVDELGINLDSLIDVENEEYNEEDDFRVENDDITDGNESEENGEINQEDEYQELELEIELLEARINDGSSKDFEQLHKLYDQRTSNPFYQRKMDEELSQWRITMRNYCITCLKTMRTYIPVNIFDSSIEALVQLGITNELAKRLTSKQCLWVTRMSQDEIARLHEADLVTRFSIAGHILDIVEVAAIYACAPDRFVNDPNGKKYAWRESIEQTLRTMMKDMESGNLASSRIRLPLYEECDGPIEDVESVREYEVVTGYIPVAKPRRSFEEICSQHSILRGVVRRKSKTNKVSSPR